MPFLNTSTGKDPERLGVRIFRETSPNNATIVDGQARRQEWCRHPRVSIKDVTTLEFAFRIGGAHLFSLGSPRERPRWLKDWWFQGVLWSSEAPAEGPCARQSPFARRSHRKGRLWQPRGAAGPRSTRRTLKYTREVLVPYLDADDMRTCIECPFGDAAARTLGFSPTGLSPWVGLALALHDAAALRAPV